MELEWGMGGMERPSQAQWLIGGRQKHHYWTMGRRKPNEEKGGGGGEEREDELEMKEIN
jgi:hypothetical protein